jgi:hypothetical protein
MDYTLYEILNKKSCYVFGFCFKNIGFHITRIFHCSDGKEDESWDSKKTISELGLVRSEYDTWRGLVRLSDSTKINSIGCNRESILQTLFTNTGIHI